MFRRRKRNKSAWDEGSVSDPGRPSTSKTERQPSQPLEHWRTSAQRVAREWNAWLAAEGYDRSVRYGRFVSALADEEQAAAEVQRMT